MASKKTELDMALITTPFTELPKSEQIRRAREIQKQLLRRGRSMKGEGPSLPSMESDPMLAVVKAAGAYSPALAKGIEEAYNGVMPGEAESKCPPCPECGGKREWTKSGRMGEHQCPDVIKRLTAYEARRRGDDDAPDLDLPSQRRDVRPFGERDDDDDDD